MPFTGLLKKGIQFHQTQAGPFDADAPQSSQARTIIAKTGDKARRRSHSATGHHVVEGTLALASPGDPCEVWVGLQQILNLPRRWFL
jgi:hypothetical protein